MRGSEWRCGCDKADAWGIATNAGSTIQMETVRLTFQPAKELQHNDETAEIRNKCLFLRTMNANLQDDVWGRLCAEIDSSMPVQGTANVNIQSSSITRNSQSDNSSHNPTTSSRRSIGGGSTRADTVLSMYDLFPLIPLITAPRYLSDVSPMAIVSAKWLAFSIHGFYDSNVV